MPGASEAYVFVYVVARDFGFAPNPFFGFCTLACCKPKIRSKAVVGDWVFGVAGSKLMKPGHCVFAMRVTETLSFNAYWSDGRFAAKKPVRNGSRARMLGDNIYHRVSDARPWQQEDSHHSRPDGQPEQSNIARDTSTNKVLVSTDFRYFGQSAPEVPIAVFDAIGYENRFGHRKFLETEAEPLLAWYRNTSSEFQSPVVDDPFQFRQSASRYSAETDRIIDEVVERLC